jgi:hypothetical protein
MLIYVTISIKVHVPLISLYVFLLSFLLCECSHDTLLTSRLSNSPITAPPFRTSTICECSHDTLLTSRLSSSPITAPPFSTSTYGTQR